MRLVPVLALALLLAAPLASSIPAAPAWGRVDGTTGCSPVALGGGCTRWASTLPSDYQSGRIASSQGRLFTAGGFEHIEARDATSGAPLWSRDDLTTSFPVQLDVGADGQRVYLYDWLGSPALSALDARTGALLWQADVGGYGLLGSHGDVVFVTPNGTDVQARDAATGALLWTHARAIPGDSLATFAFSPDGSIVYVPGRQIEAFRVSDGEPLWAYTPAPSEAWMLTRKIEVDPARGRLVGVGNLWTNDERELGSALFALDATTGAPRWVVESTSSMWTLALAGGAAVVGENSNGTHGFSLETGARVWDEAPGAAISFATCKQAVSGGSMAYVACSTGLAAIDGATGEKLWERPITADLVALDAEHGILATVGREGVDTRAGLIALDTSTGRLAEVLR